MQNADPYLTSSSFSDGYEVPGASQKLLHRYDDSGGNLRTEARMTLRTESSLSQTLREELSDDEVDCIQHIEKMNTLQKRVQSLSKIHETVRVL